MWEFLTNLLNPAGFPARWNCGLAWSQEPGVAWLHMVSDFGTFLAYYAVPCVVGYFVARHHNVKLPRVFYVFLGLIFFSCGTVHLVEAGMFYWPIYRFSGLLKALTAIVSLSGVAILVKILPRVLELKSGEAYRREVQGREEAEALLELERNVIHTLMTTLPDAIYFKDKQGRFLRISQALANKFGIDDVSSALGKTDQDFFTQEHAAQAKVDEQQIMDTGKPIVGLVEKETWPDGHATWVSTTKAPLLKHNGELLGTFGVSRDITPIKLAEQQLSQVASKLALPRQTGPERPKPTTLSNFSLQSMIQCGDDIRGMGVQHASRDAFASHLVHYLRERFTNAEGASEFALVRLFVTSDYAELTPELQSIAKSHARGGELRADTKCLVLLGTVGDVLQWNDCANSTGHRVIPLPNRRTVDELPMLAHLLQQLGLNFGNLRDDHEEAFVDHISTGVFHVENAKGSPFIPAQTEFVIPYGIHSAVGFGNILPSGQMFAVLGFSKVHVARATATLFSHLSLSTKLALLAYEDPVTRVEAQITCVDQLIRNYEDVVCKQESDLHLTMQQLVDARDNANAANRAKSDFLANMSHEIRTPMNAVIGMTELVLETELNASQREYLSTVLESGEALLAIINEILDFSKIEAGRVELESVTFNLREELGDTMKSLAIRAHRKELELAWSAAADVPANIVSDPQRLRQIIVNLAGNAIKFTNEGEVVLEVTSRPLDETHIELHFSIRDTGVGIPADKFERIFSEFEQADTSTTRRFGGTGLGLSISSRLVELFQGRIWVESQLGQGSTFHFSIPVEVSQDTHQPVSISDPHILEGMRVLIVDDNPTNRRILKDTVASWKMTPLTAESGQQALEILTQAQAEQRPVPLVLTDVHMPGMNGYTLVEKIREREFNEPIILALSSGAQFGHDQRWRKLRIAVELLKPVKQSELLDSILKAVTPLHALQPEAADTAHQSGTEATQLAPLRILLAEDGKANQMLAVGLLEMWGHQVTVAENGRIAIETLEQGEFDLVLMDLQMPELDGISATHLIRQQEQLRGGHIPILAMTAHALKGDSDRCIAAGMDGYISKPVRKQELYDAIRPFQETIERPLPAPRSGDKPSISQQQTVNWDIALDAVGGSAELLQQVCQTAIDELMQLVDDMQQASLAKDAVRLKRAAHTVRSSARIFGADKIEAMAGQIEHICQQESLAEAESIRLQLTRSIEQLVAALKERLQQAD